MNLLRAGQVGFRLLMAIATREQQQRKTYGTGDLALYVGCVELAKQLERQNPGIAQTAGYFQSVTESLGG